MANLLSIKEVLSSWWSPNGITFEQSKIHPGLFQGESQLKRAKSIHKMFCRFAWSGFLLDIFVRIILVITTEKEGEIVFLSSLVLCWISRTDCKAQIERGKTKIIWYFALIWFLWYLPRQSAAAKSSCRFEWFYFRCSFWSDSSLQFHFCFEFQKTLRSGVQDVLRW